VIGHDGIVAALHIFHCCHGSVSFGQVGTSATGVIAIESKAVHPTVIHVEAIIGYDGTCSCRDTGECSGHGCGMQSWLVIGQFLNVCCIGTMRSCLACGELAQAFFVFAGEVFTKFHECLLCCRADAPSVACCGEHASCFEHYEHEVLDGIISQGITAGDRNALDLMQLLPQILDGIIQCPNGCNAGAIVF